MQFRTQRGNLLTLCERKTRFTLTAPLKTKLAAETGTEIIKVLGALPQGARKTVTFDNGGEFAQHLRVEAALGIVAYFCDPHSPWQRGTIENTNGIPAPRHAEKNRHHKLYGPRHQRHNLGRQLNPQKMSRL